MESSANMPKISNFGWMSSLHLSKHSQWAPSLWSLSINFLGKNDLNHEVLGDIPRLWGPGCPKLRQLARWSLWLAAAALWSNHTWHLKTNPSHRMPSLCRLERMRCLPRFLTADIRAYPVTLGKSLHFFRASPSTARSISMTPPIPLTCGGVGHEQIRMPWQAGAGSGHHCKRYYLSCRSPRLSQSSHDSLTNQQLNHHPISLSGATQGLQMKHVRPPTEKCNKWVATDAAKKLTKIFQKKTRSRFPSALGAPLRPEVQRSPRSQSSLAPLRRQSASAPHGPPGRNRGVGIDIGNTQGTHRKHRKTKIQKWRCSWFGREPYHHQLSTGISQDFPFIFQHANLLRTPTCGVAWMNARAASAEKSGSGICSAAGWRPWQEMGGLWPWSATEDPSGLVMCWAFHCLTAKMFQ